MAKNRNFKGDFSDMLGSNSGSLELTVLPTLRDYIPSLTDEEALLLEEDIKKQGVRDSIDVWVNSEFGKAVVIDGHNRFRIAKNLKIRFSVKEHTFKDIEEVKIWMLEKQLGRRNLTDASRKYLLGLYYNENKSAKGAYDRTQEGTKVTVAQTIAKGAKVSEKTVRSAGKMAEGISKLSPEFKIKVLSGEAKVKNSDLQKLSKIDNVSLGGISSPEEIKLAIDSNANNFENKKGSIDEEAHKKDCSNLLKKLVKLLSKVDESTALEVTSELVYTKLNIPNSSINTLLDDGYALFRVCKTKPSIYWMSGDIRKWTLLESQFKNITERDVRLKALLEGQKSIKC